MYDRLLEAISKLKANQDEMQSDFNEIKKQWDKENNFYLQKLMRKMEEDLTNYTIQDGFWFYNGVSTGIKAEGMDGQDGRDGKTGEQGPEGNGIESINKTASKGLIDVYTINYTNGTYSTYNVRNGKDGKTGPKGEAGAAGLPGRDGKDGEPGKDGITPIIKIGKVEVSPEYGGANASLRKSKSGNIFYLDLVLPRGPQGFVGFDGKDGKSLEYDWNGTSLGIRQEGEAEYEYVNLKGDAGSIKMQIVAELPETGDEDTIYLVPIDPDISGNNYAEYIYVNNSWEMLGKIGVAVDLTNYVTKDTTELLNYYTKTEINTMIGDIGTALDTISGEVI